MCTVYVYLYLPIDRSYVETTSSTGVYLRFPDCRVRPVPQFHRVNEKENYTIRANLRDSEADVKNRITYKK